MAVAPLHVHMGTLYIPERINYQEKKKKKKIEADYLTR